MAVAEKKYTKFDVSAGEEYVNFLMHEEVAPKNVLHNYDDTRKMLDRADLLLSKEVQLDQRDRDVIKLAVLFLNTGYIHQEEDYLQKSIEIAEKFFVERNISPAFVQDVIDCLQSIESEDALQNYRHAVFHDIVNGFIGEKKLGNRISQQVLESNLFREKPLGELDVVQKMHKKFRDHRFNTKYAEKIWSKRKKKNLAKLKKKIFELRESAKITNNKSAQTMIKTALRNQVDLVAIADKKAGIMISLNAILLTIMIPVFSTALIDVTRFYFPMIILMVTCGVTVILAALATQPGKMKGDLKKEEIREGTRSLFYFGNYTEMKREDYLNQLRNVVVRDRVFENSMINHLYDLGHILGRKYQRLRICYTVFIIGIGLTIIIFALMLFYPTEL